MKDDLYDACAWGSHLPALLGCLADTVGPVLELGIGHFSTPALHAYCVQAGRPLHSVEQDEKWFREFSKYEHKSHAFYLCEYDKALQMFTDHFWSVVLIDNSPGGKRRLDDFKAYLPKSTFVVVHDYHLENAEAIKPLLSPIQHHVTRSYQPPTLIASELRKIPQSILCM